MKSVRISFNAARKMALILGFMIAGSSYGWVSPARENTVVQGWTATLLSKIMAFLGGGPGFMGLPWPYLAEIEMRLGILEPDYRPVLSKTIRGYGWFDSGLEMRQESGLDDDFLCENRASNAHHHRVSCPGEDLFWTPVDPSGPFCSYD